MHRRNLCKGAVALGLVMGTPGSLLRAAGRLKPMRRVRPTDAAWPAPAAWQRLKAAVDGHLLQVPALFGACERGSGDASCREALQNLANPFYIGDQPGGTQVSGWLNAWQPAPSVYAVAARQPSHVVAAVNFARDNNLRLVVKGGGHSYQGTSNAPDSLLVWTRAMNRIELHDSFVPRGCEGRIQPHAAVSIESGAVWIDAYNAVTTQAGRYVQGGGCATVGVAGLIQSGGFGSFSKGFGTAASSLLEAEIVTADGRLRTVNACSDPELHWALKGGGGGNWGVVTRVTLKTHPLPENFGGVGGSIKAKSEVAYRRLLARFVDFYADSLFNPHWGEQVSVHPDNTLGLSLVCQGLDDQQVNSIWKPFLDQVRADPELSVSDALWVGAGNSRNWWDPAWHKTHGGSMVGDSRAGAPATHAWWRGDQEQVGSYLYAYESAWLPSSLLQPSQRERLAAALFAGSRHHDIGLHFNKGLAGAPPEAIAAASDTATNPGVKDAFALAIVADGGPPAYPGLPGATAPDAAKANRIALDVGKAMQELREFAPRMGSYYSESNFFERDWQHSHWGEHYSRLRAAKAKYDPDGLFFVHHGAGSEDWSADGFSRIAGS
ncbi:MAG TPA: FAD-binding protein [Steroidobacteraceae bacterium]|nr:FAD-binding protein [Steroidobacteraceae bacterium]